MPGCSGQGTQVASKSLLLCRPLQEFAPGGDLYEELKRCGGRMQAGEAAHGYLAPFLAALLYLHGKVRGRWVAWPGQCAVMMLAALHRHCWQPVAVQSG